VGFEMGKPGAMLAAEPSHLRATIHSPMFGEPHTPDRIRVASGELARALRDALPSALEIVCGPTPEIDHLVASMSEHTSEDAPSYLSAGVGPDAIAKLFHAAASLFRAEPWKIVPSDDSLFAVTIESMGVRGAALSIIGQLGESFGFLLFAGLADFDAFLAAADAARHGDLALNFERGGELPSPMRREIASHRWEVAKPDAYPWLIAVDAGMVARSASAKELVIAEAICLALPEMLSEPRIAGAAAWIDERTTSRTMLVETHAGPVEITLRAPYSEEPRRERPSAELLADLAALTSRAGAIDDEARRRLEDELVERFAASPEARRLEQIQACRFVVDFALSYFGETVATLRGPQLRQILFEIIPNKVVLDRSQARWIIEETRAFFAFLKRDLRLPNADECLRVFAKDAVKRLEGALANTAAFGIAKSIVTAGREAGFAVDTQEGLEAWMRELQGRPLPPEIALPSAPPAQARPTRATRKKNPS